MLIDLHLKTMQAKKDTRRKDSKMSKKERETIFFYTESWRMEPFCAAWSNLQVKEEQESQ